MKHKRPPLPVVVLLTLLVLTALFFLIRELTNRNGEELTASGSIEAVSISVAPEIGGKVIEVFVEEGVLVRLGDPLFAMDDTLLQAQRQVASANLLLAQAASETAAAVLVTAQANHDLAIAAARAESTGVRTSDWTSEFASSTTRSDEITAAQHEVTAARVSREAARENLSALLSQPEAADFSTAEIRLLDARAAFQVAQVVLGRAGGSASVDLRDAAQSVYDIALEELDSAQADYDEIKDSEAAVAILSARAILAVSQERLDAARDRLLSLQIGDDSLKVAAAEAALKQAQEAADQAQAAVEQAMAALDLVDVQIGKLTVIAPSPGVILTRTIQPGEVIPAGGTAIKLARLDDLTITVFIPEDRYGELFLGQAATVVVDSFPDETFKAAITSIASEAEFTPRNVQTVEGRSSTVYAITLQVEDPSGRLKPGMPADVTFDR